MGEIDSNSERILVIKHGALGDFILSTGPFMAIRSHHVNARVTLLTTPPYESLGLSCGWFDDVWVDQRPPVYKPKSWLTLRNNLAEAGFSRVYDLQTSTRTGWYFFLWPGPRPEWSGIAPGCSHPHRNQQRDEMHTIQRQAEQLVMANLDAIPPPNVDWLRAPIQKFGLARDYVLLIPGGSPLRLEKRWPAEYFSRLAQKLSDDGYTPVLIGTQAEKNANHWISQHCEAAIDLTGRTSLPEVAALCRRASVVIGNDTGPMHIAAAAGCRALVLFSCYSNPKLCGPQAPKATILQRDHLCDLPVEEVLSEAMILLSNNLHP